MHYRQHTKYSYSNSNRPLKHNAELKRIREISIAYMISIY